jgi:signal transduction histidine kinase
MEPMPREVRLAKRAYWLIRLRWWAVAGVFLAVYFASRVLHISLECVPLYCMGAVLGLHNFSAYLLLNHYNDHGKKTSNVSVRRIINYQMSVDLLILTGLLHFSGGITNPFVIYFIFHMILSSILLSPVQSYLQAVLASLLLILLAAAEYTGFVDHHSLAGFVAHDFYLDKQYIAGMIFAVITTLFLAVYMTSSIAIQQRVHEEGYREANIALNEKDRIKDEYVARVTHDIKGHLAAIRSCLDVLAGGMAGPLGEKQGEFVMRAHTRTKKLTLFIHSLLKLTRMRLAHNIPKEEFLLSDTINAAIATVGGPGQAKDITIETELAISDVIVTGNQVSIEELITGLLNNAIKYTQNGGNVVLNAQDSRDNVTIEVRDNGMGIPEESVARVFEEFYRASNAKSTEKDGTGLGLSIAKQIVERHGGEISAKNNPEKGATFTFSFAKDSTA